MELCVSCGFFLFNCALARLYPFLATGCLCARTRPVRARLAPALSAGQPTAGADFDQRWVRANAPVNVAIHPRRQPASPASPAASSGERREIARNCKAVGQTHGPSLLAAGRPCSARAGPIFRPIRPVSSHGLWRQSILWSSRARSSWILSIAELGRFPRRGAGRDGT